MSDNSGWRPCARSSSGLSTRTRLVGCRPRHSCKRQRHGPRSTKDGRTSNSGTASGPVRPRGSSRCDTSDRRRRGAGVAGECRGRRRSGDGLGRSLVRAGVLRAVSAGALRHHAGSGRAGHAGCRPALPVQRSVAVGARRERPAVAAHHLLRAPFTAAGWSMCCLPCLASSSSDSWRRRELGSCRS